MTAERVVFQEWKTVRDVPWYVEKVAHDLIARGWQPLGERHIATPEGTCQPIAVQAFTRIIRCKTNG